jgi:hypothetical protein
VYADEIEHDRDTAVRLIQEAGDRARPGKSLSLHRMGLHTRQRKKLSRGDHEVSAEDGALGDVGIGKFGVEHQCLYHDKDYAGAISKYQQALALDPNNQGFRSNLKEAEAEKKKNK